MEKNEVTCKECKDCEGNQNLICCKMQKAGLRHATTQLKSCVKAEEAQVLLLAISNSLQEYPCTPCKVLKSRVDWVCEQVEKVGHRFLAAGTDDVVIMLAEEIETLIS